MTIVDEFIGYFSPRLHLQRLKERKAIDIIKKRTFEAGAKNRQNGGWGSSGSVSSNAEIMPGLSTAISRSRDAILNNPYANKAARMWVSYAVGTGIVPSIRDKKTSSIWNVWVNHCDHNNQLDFWGVQHLIANTVYSAGSCLVRFIYDNEESDVVPLKLQVLEPDYIDDYKTETLNNGAYIQHGIEYNKNGKVLAYWLFPQHPGDNGRLFKSYNSVRVDAEDVVHVFKIERPGQSRGIPANSSSLNTIKNLQDYEEATLMRKWAEACITAFVETDDEGQSLGEVSKSGNQIIEEMSPNMVKYLAPSEKITFNNPPASDNDHNYVQHRHYEIAAGSQVSYEQMTGNLSNVNYSSIRTGKLDFKREIEQFQWLTFIPMCLRKIMKKWVSIASVSHSVKINIDKIEWTTPKWDWTDPLKDAKAEELEIAGYQKTWSESMRERGKIPEVAFEEAIKEKQMFEDAGIPYPPTAFNLKSETSQTS